MSWFSDLFSGDYMSGGDTSDAYNAAQNLLNERKANQKGAQQIMRESRAAAGQAAADKAGQAKKAAVGAARMANASKLTAATQGANAAANASKEGYDEMAQSAGALEAQKEQNLNEIAKQQAGLMTQQAEEKAKRKASSRQAALGAVGTMFGGAASATSDKTAKVKKHCYIAKEER